MPNVSKQIEKECPICHVIYLVTSSHINQKTCLKPECTSKYISMIRSGENNNRWKGGKVKKICEICGSEYYVKLSLVNKRRTCGKSECRYKYTSGENSDWWRGGKVTAICKICGGNYYIKPSNLGKINTCPNKDCKHTYKSQSMRGDKHPQWKGGLVRWKCIDCEKLSKLFPPSCSNQNEEMYRCQKCAAIYRAKQSDWVEKHKIGVDSYWSSSAKYTSVIKNCIVCNSEFKCNQSTIRWYCSKECGLIDRHYDLWYGGVKPFDYIPISRIIRKSSNYNQWRLSILKRDNNIDYITKKECINPEVHHLIHFNTLLKKYNIKTVEDAINCEDLWDLSNGITVDHDTHIAIFHSWADDYDD